MINTVSCPQCGASIELTQALVEQIQKQLVSEMEHKHKTDLEHVKKEAEQAVKKQLEEKNLLEMADLKKQIEEKETKVRKMQGEELQLREKTRKLEEKEKEMDLVIIRKVDEERKKVEETVLKQTQEAYRLKEMEKEKVISDLRKSLEDAQRKAQQGSQQTQGEVAELDLENSLRMSYPEDTVMSVEKGVRGADVRQIVKTKIGNTCGVILWESKRTKAWSAEWVSKLKEDVRAEKANIAIIVSTVLPEEAKNGFGFIDGVYVCTSTLSIPIASLLRQRLIDVAREKFINANREGNAERLYEYMTSHEFRLHIEAIVEVYQDMNGQIGKERAAFEKIWKTREAQVQKLLSSTAGMVGSIRGVVGQSLPTVKGLELLESEEERPKLI
jgi:hypothetical protein